ncbi:MAG: EAL domain-containing protein [Candidatus Paracaedibacteraceae bacterium]|nr:EAL domain-containing protein [Candidatus Paracaedibacteraceae bacterium]
MAFTFQKHIRTPVLSGDFSQLLMLPEIENGAYNPIFKDAHYMHKQSFFESIIENKHFALFGQRQKNMDQGLFLGTEVLLRVPTPSNPNIYLSTAYWIGFAEHIDKIEHLSLQILAQLIENSDLLNAEYAPYYVNIPPPIVSVALVEYIKNLLDKADLPPNFIGIELTERQPVTDPTSFRRGIDAFQRLSIPIALDDYGRGYATMQFLRDVPVNRVKIDQDLLHVAKTNKSQRLTLDSLLDFANAFDIEVIAEGVETEDDYAFVRKLGCDGMQGFYIDSPAMLIPIPSHLT